MVCRGGVWGEGISLLRAVRALEDEHKIVQTH